MVAPQSKDGSQPPKKSNNAKIFSASNEEWTDDRIKDFEKELYSKRFAEDNSFMDENSKILIKKNGPLSPAGNQPEVKKEKEIKKP
jgi:hypothetical protein